MSKMQKVNSNKDGNNHTKGTQATVILSLVSGILILGLIVLPSQSQAQALKIIVYFKYDNWQKHHAKTLNQIVLNAYSAIDEVEKKLDLTKLPKKKTINMDVDVGQKFSVHLNSYATDDGEQSEGINHPSKSPEKITVRVP